MGPGLGRQRRRRRPCRARLVTFHSQSQLPIAAHAGVGYYRRHSWGRPEPSHEGRRRVCCELADAEQEADLCSCWDRHCVALALGAGYCVVQRNGTAWWDSAPPDLHDSLWSSSRSPQAVDYVALGGSGQYFLQLADGGWELVGPHSLRAALCDGYASGCSVEQLAFAPNGGW